ncbi:MAG: PDZ domain-containing protein [Gemmataceae bacterium]|nr:PDZ domain-containing protein [Gemmataceae bacterium]MCI0742546.1 PDZ domain-containing protein [Gemmataceae bacterium]
MVVARILLTLAALTGIAAIGAAFVTGTAPAAQESARVAGANQAAEAEIEKLIAQLGSPQYTAREEATRALLKLGELALPFLKKAIDSKDNEIQRRAQQILDQVNIRLTEQAIRRVVGGGIDQLVERLVMKKVMVSAKDWSDLVMLAEAASFNSTAKRARGLKSARYLNHEPVITDQLTTRGMNCARVLAHRVIDRGKGHVSATSDSIIVCTGPVEIGPVSNCLIFANGKTTLKLQVIDSIIFCDDDVEISSLHNSVVLARGAVRTDCFDSVVLGRGPISAAAITRTLVHAKAPVAIGVADKSVMRSEGAVTVDISVRDNIIEEKTGHEALELFTFFEAARLGIQVALLQSELRVTHVEPKTPFARAGLKAGDVIVRMDKKKPVSAEEFRRLLRKKELEGRTTLSVRRAEDTLEVVVVFRPDNEP